MKRRPPRSIRRRRAAAQTEPEGEEILDLVLGEPAHGGACVARDDSGRVVFVRHGLPGEHVRALVTSRRNRLAWADAVEILEASADRVPSVWPQAGPGGVGGGELAHVRPEAQRRWKADVLRGQIRRVGGEDLAAAVDAIGGVEVRPAPGDGDDGDALLGRRTRIELVIDGAGLAGMHRHRSREVVALDSMPLAVPAIVELGLFGKDSPWRGLWSAGDRIRAVSSAAGGTVVLTPTGAYGPEREKLASEDPALTRQVVTGSGSRDFAVRASGFWQTHVHGADVLAQEVERVAQVEAGAGVMELYSGAGLFTRLLAEAAGPSGRVVSLEGDEKAVGDAHLALEDLSWAEPYVGSVDASGVAELAGALEVDPALVVLDPPRAGAGREVCQALGSLNVPRVVLVACDPAAGARDLRELTGAGYTLASLRAWDLFPHTHHVEFVATLSR